MAIETTALGFQKPDGNDPLRNGDNVIAANAQKAEDRHQEDRGRLSLIEAKNTEQDAALADLPNQFVPLSRGSLANGTDFNTLLGPQHVGAYSLLGANTYPNAPAGLSGTCVLEVQRGSGNSLSVVHRVTSGTALLWREAVDAAAGTWSAWVQAETKTDAAAKNAEQDGRLGAIESAAPSATFSQDAVYSITDKDGRRSWVEIGADGRPTAHSTGILAASVAPGVGALLPALPQPLPESSGPVYAIVDSLGRQSWIQIGPDGRPTAQTLLMLQAAGLGGMLNDGAVTEVKLAPSLAQRVPLASSYRDGKIQTNRGLTVRDRVGNVLPAASDGAVIACWGDSLTEGWPYADVNPATQSWPAVLDSLYTNGTTYNGGKAGQSADEIALRQGGLVLMVTVSGGSIPASGAVTVTTSQLIAWRLDRSWSCAVSIAGVDGTLTRTSATDLTFIRTASGSAVAAAGKVQVISTPGETYKSNVSVVFAGRNDIGYSSPAGSEANRVVEATAAMVDRLAAANPRCLLVGTTTTTGELSGSAGYNTVTAINAALKKLYPENFYDLRNYLVAQCIYDQGITPTADDLVKIGADTLPPSIMVAGDSTHYSAGTAAKVAAKVYEQLNSKGWLL
ncbi:hypothetical protein SRABI26_02664 [Arthrobacter sp. Bi26]|uniref:pyocin knob domain-containing protein n=1 Tax=Arthrobacter sp. Bi26 TaxID=2822350 RepID=UPI001DB04F55|nr:pyocin knob domain-containing protein [Arthrobacter sp. Bi26]CAH0231635.1 hypothetical protein SRABI26_02664 [Arthrobacter sp. Bi26]